MKYVVTLNGKDYEVEVDELDKAIVTNISDATAPKVTAVAPASAPVATHVPSSATVSDGSGTNIKSPMPGTILKVNVSVGQNVKAGDVIFILEAMKMENEIVAPVDGKITSVVTTKGSTVATDDVLAVIGGNGVVSAPVVSAPVVQATPAPVASAPVSTVSSTGTAVKAPMPGTILKVSTVAGQPVKAGDIMFILEAMKMENEIVSPIDGTVSSVVTSKGSTVATDDVLAFIG